MVFWDELYFSVITITSLGFGDIFPINVYAKAAVVTELLIGIISIGLFLNEVAQYRADIAAQSEKDRAEKARQHAEKNSSIPTICGNQTSLRTIPQICDNCKYTNRKT